MLARHSYFSSLCEMRLNNREMYKFRRNSLMLLFKEFTGTISNPPIASCGAACSGVEYTHKKAFSIAFRGDVYSLALCFRDSSLVFIQSLNLLGIDSFPVFISLRLSSLSENFLLLETRRLEFIVTVS